jgi:hypothetical protein
MTDAQYAKKVRELLNILRNFDGLIANDASTGVSGGRMSGYTFSYRRRADPAFWGLSHSTLGPMMGRHAEGQPVAYFQRPRDNMP